MDGSEPLRSLRLFSHRILKTQAPGRRKTQQDIEEINLRPFLRGSVNRRGVCVKLTTLLQCHETKGQHGAHPCCKRLRKLYRRIYVVKVSFFRCSASVCARTGMFKCLQPHVMVATRCHGQPCSSCPDWPAVKRKCHTVAGFHSRCALCNCSATFSIALSPPRVLYVP